MTDTGKSNTYPRSTMQDELLDECQAMVRYAFASGFKVPGAVVETLETYLDQEEGGVPGLPEGQSNISRSESRDSEQPASSLQGLNQSARQLARIHGQLADIIAPATPRTVLLLAKEEAKGGVWRFLGPVPLIRKMMVVAIVSLISLIVVSLSPDVDGYPKHFSLLENSGISLLLNELFLLCAAAIGASFAALFQANRFIQDGTFDPVYEVSYWIRFVLGLLAGTMLASLIPIESYVEEEGGRVSGSLQGLGTPLLALLGGFSASAVHRILTRLTAAVEALVRGDTRDMLAVQEQAVKTRYAEKAVQHRLQLSTKLTKLQQLITSNGNPEKVRQELERIRGDLITPGSYEDEQEANPTPEPQEKKAN